MFLSMKLSQSKKCYDMTYELAVRNFTLRNSPEVWLLPPRAKSNRCLPSGFANLLINITAVNSL